MISSGRGMLCDSIQEKAKKFLGEEITTKELRLYPYLDYVWKNRGNIEYSKVTEEERGIIGKRVDEGHMQMFFDAGLCPTREFYDFVQDVLADTYVVLVDDKEF